MDNRDTRAKKHIASLRIASDFHDIAAKHLTHLDPRGSLGCIVWAVATFLESTIKAAEMGGVATGHEIETWFADARAEAKTTLEEGN